MRSLKPSPGGKVSAKLTDEECGRYAGRQYDLSGLVLGRSCRHSSPAPFGGTLSPGEGIFLGGRSGKALRRDRGPALRMPIDSGCRAGACSRRRRTIVRKPSPGERVDFAQQKTGEEWRQERHRSKPAKCSKPADFCPHSSSDLAYARPPSPRGKAWRKV